MNKYKVYRFRGDYKCGHYGKINKGGYTEEYAQDRANEEFAGLCPECLAEERAKEAAKIAQELEEKGYPTLRGTDKQITWAEQIRKELIEFAKNEQNPRIKKSYENWLMVEDSASTLINRRNLTKSYTREDLEWLVGNYETIELEEVIEERAITQDSLYKPENYNGLIVTVEVEETEIITKTEKNREFIDLVKSLGYKWVGVWKKEITEFTGDADDRAVELIYTLLKAGFAVKTNRPENLEKAIAGEVTKEHTDWVYRNGDNNRFSILAKGKYDELKHIKFMKYSKGHFFVESHYYKELEDWSEANGYRLSAAAKELAREAENKYHEQMIALEDVKPSKETIADVKDIIAEDGIIEDLRDN